MPTVQRRIPPSIGTVELKKYFSGATKIVEYDDFLGDACYNFKENSDIYKKCFEPIDEQESCTDDSIKEIIRKY